MYQTGKQEDGRTWVMNSTVQIREDGCLIVPDDQQYVWLGDMYTGLGIAKAKEDCNIQLPLTIDPLCRLVNWIKESMLHNLCHL